MATCQWTMMERRRAREANGVGIRMRTSVLMATHRRMNNRSGVRTPEERTSRSERSCRCVLGESGCCD